MKITIITHGIPNSQSEQANNDPLLFFKFFEKKRIKYNLISIWDQDYNTSKKSRTLQEKYLKKNFKHLKYIKIINYKKTLAEKITRFFNRIFSDKSYYFFGNKKIHKEVQKQVKFLKSKLILNFYELPSSISHNVNSNIKIFNYLGVYRKSSEILKIKNLIKNKNIFSFFKILNAFIYIFKIENLYLKFLKNAELNFCASKDTYDYFKKKNNNMYYSGPLSTDRSKIEKREKKIPTVLMIGALTSNFMQDSVTLIANSAEQLNEIYKKNKFKLRIVGKYKSSRENIKKLNYPWVEFAGWVKSAEEEYSKASFIFVPNSLAIGARTKILEAASSKVCIITTKENIKNFFPNLINFKDIIVTKNMNEFCKNFEKVLVDKNLRKKLVKSAKDKYYKYYSPEKCLRNNFNLIKKYAKA